MQIHFSQDLNLNESKKDIISVLVSQRINLLIGARKASYIENVFFCDAIPKEVLFLSNSTTNHNLIHHIGFSKDRGKTNLYCTFRMLYTLIHQTTEGPCFDDAMIVISREISISIAT